MYVDILEDEIPTYSKLGLITFEHLYSSDVHENNYKTSLSNMCQ